MKKFVSILLILIFVFVPVSASASTKFKDVSSSYWAASNIAEANELGIISGYNDKTFRPKKNVNKQEAFVMLFRVIKNGGLVNLSGYIPAQAPETDTSAESAAEEYVQYVSDVTPDSEEGQIILDQYVTAWTEVLNACAFSDNIEMKRAAAYGLQTGICEAADFAAGAKTDASRELIAKWSCKALGYELAPLSVLPYSDSSSVSPECINAVDALYRHGIMIGGTDGSFKPGTGIIRAEIAAIAVRMLKDIQSERVLTLENTLVSLYGTVTEINIDTAMITMVTQSGTKYLSIASDAQLYYDGMTADFWSLDLTGRSITISALNGGDSSIKSVYIQSGPMVQTGTVLGDIQQFSDFYMVNILQSGGVSNTFVYTDKTLGRIPVSGSDITFISDGLELIEVK